MSKVRTDTTAKLVHTIPPTASIQTPEEFIGLVYVRYRDHVMFSRVNAEVMQPQVRKAVGWLVYECDVYTIVMYDVDDMPPILRGGDPKASELVVLRV